MIPLIIGGRVAVECGVHVVVACRDCHLQVAWCAGGWLGSTIEPAVPHGWHVVDMRPVCSACFGAGDGRGVVKPTAAGEDPP